MTYAPANPSVSSRESELQLLGHLADAIRHGDLDKFCEHTQLGIAYFGEAKVQQLLRDELPLHVSTELVPTLLRYMAGDDHYIDVVTDMLTELCKMLSGEGLSPGKDFSYGTDDGEVPFVRLTPAAANTAEDLLQASAWKTALPYLKVQ